MTLSRQLIVLLTLLLLLVFAGTFLINVQNARTYLEAQLRSHAQDTATSLGLSLSPRLAEDDTASAISMIDAIFDRGYYRRIRLEDLQGRVLVNRELPVRVKDVPPWFVEALPLETPRGEALIMAGWRQAGRIRVWSHPGFAYRQLWENVIETLGWFVASALLVGMLGLALLRRVLSPLRRIEWQAEAICNREFPVLEKLPRTRDLRRIVEAMNRLSTRLQAMLTEHEALAARLREQAHQDPVTGLANKSHFMAGLDNRLDSPEACATALLALVQLRDLKAYNDRHGYAAGDERLRQLAARLHEVTAEIPRSLLAHLSGGDFALLAEDYQADDGAWLGQRLSEALAGLCGEQDGPADNGHIGIACFDGRQNASRLLAEADEALRLAQTKGANGWALLTPDAKTAVATARSASEWRHFIQQALTDERLVLHLQPVYRCPEKEILHHEVLLRLKETPETGRLLSAGHFMPRAENLGLSPQIDRLVIQRVLRLLKEEADPALRLAVNLSPASLREKDFPDWLEARLWQHRQVSPQIIFELPEYGAVPLLEQTHELIRRAERCGSRVALDHFGRGFSAFAYLRSLKIAYLKVDGSYLGQLDQNPDHRFFLQALTDIAHGLEIEVIAEAVESEPIWQHLAALHIDGGQGYWLGRPRPAADKFGT